jgi:Holliday junction resolvase RusA-like endonuclease
MAVHREFVVLGPPISNQQSKAKGRANLTAWKATIAGAVATSWVRTKMTIPLKATIINFHGGATPSVNVDNMSKPIFDEMQKVVYDDDRQVRQAEIIHVEVGAPFSIAGVSKIIVNALQAGNQFVYVRVEDPVTPCPLPA